MWLSGCLLAAPTTPLYSAVLSFSLSPRFFPLFHLHSAPSLTSSFLKNFLPCFLCVFPQNHNLSKVCDDQNFLPLLAAHFGDSVRPHSEKNKTLVLFCGTGKTADMDEGEGNQKKNKYINMYSTCVCDVFFLLLPLLPKYWGSEKNRSRRNEV